MSRTLTRRLTSLFLAGALVVAVAPMAMADEDGEAKPDKAPKHVAAVALALEISEAAATDLLANAADQGVNANQVIRLHALSVVTGTDLGSLISQAGQEDVGYGDLKQGLTDEQLMELKLWKKSLGHFKRQVVGQGQALGHLDAAAKAEAKALHKAGLDAAKADRDQERADRKAARDEAKAIKKAAQDTAGEADDEATEAHND